MSTTRSLLEERQSFVERFTNGVCRRAFSSPEAFAYEATIARALARAVEPVIRSFIDGQRVLDVGCGGGLLAKELASNSGCTVAGVDPSRSQARRFSRRHRGSSAGWAVRAGAEALPFFDGTFEATYSSCAWKHWPDRSLGLSECVRVTQPGGTLVVVEIDGASTPEEFKKFADQSRVPLGLRVAYVRFALRTVVGVAPDLDELSASFGGLGTSPPSVRRFDELPFLIATATVN